jgi:hypothetical protein
VFGQEEERATTMTGLCCSRRHFLTGILSTILCESPFTIAQAAMPTACASLEQGTSLINYPRRAFSDNPKLDDAVIEEIKKIVAIFPVNPELHYIDEDPPNSFALPTSDVLGTKGTVLLGLKLFTSLLNESDGAAAIAGVCAHECGHIQQFFSDSYNHLSPLGTMAIELHADLLAGYYMGRREDHPDPNRVKSFSQMLFTRSGYGFTDPNYHGSPGQRAAAVDKGYFWALDGVTFAAASTRGETWVKNLIGG